MVVASLLWGACFLPYGWGLMVLAPLARYQNKKKTRMKIYKCHVLCILEKKKRKKENTSFTPFAFSS